MNKEEPWLKLKGIKTPVIGAFGSMNVSCVVCYKKGALAIKDAISSLINESSAPDPIPPKKLKIETKTQILITPVDGD